jgi:hypothetical protein
MSRGYWITVCIVGAAMALLVGCAGNGEGLDDNGRPLSEGEPAGDLEPTIESIQEHVFTPRCVSCHSGATARNNLHLDDAQTSYDNLVGVAAVEYPALFRVAAGNPDDSYLIHKLEGTQEVGSRMPLNGPYLEQSTVDVIRQWISDGAPPPGSTTASMFMPATDE